MVAGAVVADLGIWTIAPSLALIAGGFALILFGLFSLAPVRE